MNEHQKDVFNNRAFPVEAEEICCDNCYERIIFHLKDQKGNEYSLGLLSVLEMLEYAAKIGEIPKLPISWCVQIEHSFEIGFDEDATYFDQENLKSRNS